MKARIWLGLVMVAVLAQYGCREDDQGWDDDCDRAPYYYVPPVTLYQPYNYTAPMTPQINAPPVVQPITYQAPSYPQSGNNGNWNNTGGGQQGSAVITLLNHSSDTVYVIVGGVSYTLPPQMVMPMSAPYTGNSVVVTASDSGYVFESETLTGGGNFSIEYSNSSTATPNAPDVRRSLTQ